MMAIGKWISFNQPASAVPDVPDPKPVPAPCTADGKQFGLENFGNTCYANSVLQALYFCSPFRDLVIQHIDPFASVLSSHFAPTHSPASPASPASPTRRKPERKSTQDPPPTNAVSQPLTPPTSSAPRTLFSALRALYIHISKNPADKGTVAPRAFIEKLREVNEAFRNTMHHDAHEFLNYLLNRIVEEIEEERRQRLVSGDDLPRSMKTSSTASHPPVMTASTSSSTPSDATFIHQIFEGTLTSETRCLTCENLSSRDESFLDLSIDIEQNSSVTACLRQFSASEMLCQKEKFFCDACCDLQEAERRMKIKRLPNVLALHLKRFKYQEDVQRYTKLTYRVAFPMELRLFNTVDDIPNPDRLYELFAIVVHIGNGPNHGHYISIIKTLGTWLVFDDETVEPIKESEISRYFGDSNSGSAYVLYYQAMDVDLSALGLRSASPGPVTQPVAQSELPHAQLDDSPLSTTQSIPPLPPGLTEDNVTSSVTVPEVLPRPTTPPIPIQVPLEPPEKSPRKVPSQFFKAALGRPATAGRKSSRADAVTRSSQDEKFSTMPRPTLSPITIFPRDDLKPLDGHVAGAVNGKEKDSDRSMMGWFLRRSAKVGRPRPFSEGNADIPPLPHDDHAAPGSPGCNQSVSSSSNSSKDSRRVFDSPSRASPRVSPLPLGKSSPHSHSRVNNAAHETHSRKSSSSGHSNSAPISPTPDRQPPSRPLPAIPASPQTPNHETSSPTLDHGRAQRHPGKASSRDFNLPQSPKLASRPSTSASHKKAHPSLRSAPPSTLQVPRTNTTTGRSSSKKDLPPERPRSAHASYPVTFSPPPVPVPPLPLHVLPVSATPIVARKPGMRKLSLSGPILGLMKRDKH